MLVVYDWARLTNEVPRRYALLAGLALGAIAWFLARRKTVQLARAGAFAAPFLAAITAGIFLVQEVLQPSVRAREETRLPPPPDDARDVIVVVLDTIRSDHLSAYGYARRTTPNPRCFRALEQPEETVTRERTRRQDQGGEQRVQIHLGVHEWSPSGF